MFSGLLWRGERNQEDVDRTALFADFNLDVCISKINSFARGYDLYEYYHSIPDNIETVEYRRMITRDLQNPSVRSSFSSYASAIEQVKKQEKNSGYSHHTAEKMKWHADALYNYSIAVETLHSELSQHEELTAALQELLKYLSEYLGTAEYKEWKQKIGQVREELDGRPIYFTVQKNKVVAMEEQEKDPFDKRIQRAFRLTPSKEEAREEFRPLTVFEERMAERLIRSMGQKQTLSALMKVHMDDSLLQLASDVQFFLAFFEFCRYMEEKGYYFTLPETGDRLLVESGYDAAMAVQSDRPVIANDFEIGEGERFFVITGANGGGKTTFARMIGQVLYFSQMGLMVPCKKAVIPHFTDLLSHFSDEESEKTGRGKLMEELTRLAPMMNDTQENMFVVLNELFTTAATYDAGVMGKRVLEHFVKKNCYGIYVTHIQALAEAGEGIVSMVAELQEDHHTRSFRIQRKPASEGEYEDSIITKYNMTYEQMKKVMQNGD